MRLRCEECGQVAEDDATGWRTYLARDDDDATSETVTFCQACSEREFGGAR